MKKFIMLLLLLCSVFELMAQNQNRLFIEPHQPRIRIDPKFLELYKDTTNSLTFNDIQTKYTDKFSPCVQYNEPLKSNTNYWIAFEVHNTSDNNGEWILEFQDIPFLDMFIVDTAGNVQNSRTGFLVPASQKQIKGGIREQISFALHANERKTMYALTHLNVTIKSVNFISISDSKTFNQQMVIDNFKQGIFHGLLWMMLLYNLFLFVSTRKKSYLYYVGYVFSSSVFQLEIFRYIRNFIFPETPQTSLFFGVTILIAVIFYFLLMREFIDSRKQHPRLDKILKIIIRVNIFGTVFIVASQIINYDVFQIITITSGLVNMIIFLVFVIVILIVGNKVSKIFSIGTLVLMLGTLVILIATQLGINPEETIDYFQGGIVGEIFIFSIGLSYKYKVTDQQRQKAQEDLIAQLTENEKLQTKVNRELEQKVKERTAEINQQKDKIQRIADNLAIANADIAHKNKNITASIQYAKRIQTAMLPADVQIAKILPHHFILFKPKDIVSGDFYWIKEIDNHIVVAAADCTGHGVPGAFVSMLGISFMNEILGKEKITKANEILEKLRERIKTSLNQTNDINSSKDGMDIALCVINPRTRLLQYAGANNPLYIVRNNELMEIKATRNPIGIYIHEKPFANNEIQLLNGDRVYLFSDGYADQFGGDKDMKFMAKKFKQLLLDIAHLPLDQQKQLLDTTIENWKKNSEQNDDMIIIGFEV